MSTEIHITVTTSAHTPNADRLARADRYEDIAAQSIDRRERAALYAEADRIRSEESGR